MREDQSGLKAQILKAIFKPSGWKYTIFVDVLKYNNSNYKFGKFDHNIKKISSPKDTIKYMKKEAKNWQKIFVAYIT